MDDRVTIIEYMKINLIPGTIYFGFVYRGPPISIGPRAMRKILFECQCGNLKEIYISQITIRKSKTCGDCRKIFLKHGEIYHNFVYMGDDGFVSPNTPCKKLFKCQCGKIKSIRVDSVTRESTVRCRSCNSINLISGQQYMGFSYVGKKPVEIQINSATKLLFKCSCGKEKKISMNNVTLRHNVTCGSCNKLTLNPGDSINEFRYIGQSIITSYGSHKILPFMCKCGKLKLMKVCHAQTANGCGKCSYICLKTGDSYNGFIYLGSDIEISKWDRQKLLFQCRCELSKSISLKSISAGRTKTCGACRHLIYGWYIRNKDKLCSLSGKIQTQDIPQDGISFLESMIYNHKPAAAICPACQNIYFPRFSDIKRGLSLTCGCTSWRISSKNCDLASIISDLGYKSYFEHKVDGYAYDLFVPEANLLIEYNGKWWHDKPGAKNLDERKSLVAQKNGYQFLTITEQELKLSKKAIIEKLRCMISSC